MNTDKIKGRGYSKKYRLNNKEKIREYDKYRRPNTHKKIITDLRVKKGGKCSLCNYSTEIRILHFHHLGDKLFALSEPGRTYKEMASEAEKCILLCPNCHALTHLLK